MNSTMTEAEATAAQRLVEQGFQLGPSGTERASEPCGVCAGTGRPPSGTRCICNGAGTLYAECSGLREELFRIQAKLGYYPALGQTHELVPVGELQRLRARLRAADRAWTLTDAETPVTPTDA